MSARASFWCFDDLGIARVLPPKKVNLPLGPAGSSATPKRSGDNDGIGKAMVMATSPRSSMSAMPRMLCLLSSTTMSPSRTRLIAYSRPAIEPGELIPASLELREINPPPQPQIHHDEEWIPS